MFASVKHIYQCGNRRWGCLRGLAWEIFLSDTLLIVGEWRNDSHQGETITIGKVARTHTFCKTLCTELCKTYTGSEKKSKHHQKKDLSMVDIFKSFKNLPE